MASYIINEYQTFTFSYPSALLGLHINGLPDNQGFLNNFNGTYSFQVQAADTVGIVNYSVLDALNVVIDTITLTTILKAVDSLQTPCLGVINLLYPLPAPPSGSWVLSNNYYPSFVTLLPFGFGIVALPIAGQTGILNLLFQTTTNPLTETYLLRIDINSCLPEYNFCTLNQFPIVWLNPAGGWSSYCFKGKKTYGVTIGNTKTFKTSTRIEKNYSRTDVYETIAVLSGEIPVSHAAFIKSLKYAIQAYAITTIGYVAILIEEKDFILFTDQDGLMNYNVPLKLAKEIPIQTQ